MVKVLSQIIDLLWKLLVGWLTYKFCIYVGAEEWLLITIMIATVSTAKIELELN